MSVMVLLHGEAVAVQVVLAVQVVQAHLHQDSARDLQVMLVALQLVVHLAVPVDLVVILVSRAQQDFIMDQLVPAVLLVAVAVLVLLQEQVLQEHQRQQHLLDSEHLVQVVLAVQEKEMVELARPAAQKDQTALAEMQ
jgi:hypothetical protein